MDQFRPTIIEVRGQSLFVEPLPRVKSTEPQRRVAERNGVRRGVEAFGFVAPRERLGACERLTAIARAISAVFRAENPRRPEGGSRGGAGRLNNSTRQSHGFN